MFSDQIKQPRKKMGSLFLRNLPRGVREQFKAYCARRGVSMTQKIIQFMRLCIQEDQPTQEVKR